ncbi:MAG TPA: radical SAM protein [Acidobacteriota bacterium]|mgnify:CR=1 FL=1|nr:radical SAM protein [Acidobacteriota bacterium]HRR26721.1 radical SAM protein [Acidobacteriota bacterium]HRV07032.1 radical SAM protein [Acidobacteriota bacterium]
MSTRWEQVTKLIERYPDLPPEVVFKEDVLRTGLAFSEDALRIAAGYQPKAYFIFSFDLVPIDQMPNREHLRVPEEIGLVGGPNDFRRTVVSVRVNPGSPYRVGLSNGGRLVLRLEDLEVAEVLYPPRPSFYGQTLSSGKSLMEIAPVIEWGYLIYLTVFRLCQYFGKEEECRFCDINENFRQQRRNGRSYTAVKTLDEVLEALAIIAAEDTAGRAYTLTGGSVVTRLDGLDEADFYARYAEAIEARFPGRWISKAVVQALPREGLRRLYDAGVRICHNNYEVWDARLFSLLCAGKQRHIGRDEWIRRILEASEVFGPTHVIPNFVAGVEMARPYGFTDVGQALDSTCEGLAFFMANGILPRFTTWCPEPLSHLGKHNREGAPLEYHVGLLHRWRCLLEEFRLPDPPGYGPPGIGRAVFSVSSFMDVIRPNGVPVDASPAP